MAEEQLALQIGDAFVMKILLVSGPGISLKEPYNSGIEAFIVSFANKLAGEGHTAHVLACDADAGADFTLVNPFSGSVTDKPGFFNRLRQRRQFKNLDVHSYDLIHYNMFYPHLLKEGSYFNKTSFLTLHSPADRKRTAAYKKISRQWDVTFVAISHRIKHQWDRALGADIPLICNGINMDLWPTRSSREDAYLLWSARIAKEKNVAAAICVAKHMRLPLKIAGRIADQRYFDEEVKPHLNSQIKYVGHVTQRQLSGLAKNTLAYLATATWQEPFGLAALEMLASGVPVVGFTTAVPPDWEHESVLTTPSLRWQNLIELVIKSTDISPHVCKEFASSMSIQNMTSNYVKLYREVLLKKGMSEEAVFADEPRAKNGVSQTANSEADVDL